VTLLSLLCAGTVWIGRPGHAAPAHRHSALGSVTVQWPSDGQAAISLNGHGRRASGPPVEVPIASVTKVMTAYVVLRHSPISGSQSGFELSITASDVAEALADRANGQSYVPVAAGEVMTEREALEALLLPSANNIAHALAAHFPGGEPSFVAAMNTAARQLHMTHTRYTDPSGLDSSTVSTAGDQLLLARAAMRLPAFAETVAMPRASLPVAGSVDSTDSLLGRDGFVGIKTGSTSAAGGCFMFQSRQVRGGQTRVLTGVVLGQRGGPLVSAGLSGAQQLVDSTMSQLGAAR
jgi:D-alanyl-D-alanine carboxypeptidase (penicillin-binding protein 5/6)